MSAPTSDNEIEKFLDSLRLGKYEIKAYLTLLKHGPQNYKGLITLSNIPYGKIYSTMNSLEKKGWIKIVDQRPKIFIAEDPEIFFKNYLNKKKEQVASLEKTIRRISHKLKNL